MGEYLEILKESVLAAVFVAGMMALVEILNYRTEGRFGSRLRSTRIGQVLAGSVLGAVPGCVGGFLTVGMYSQGAIGFAGLLAMSIATVGDEAFLMLAQFPVKSLYIFAGLFALALAAGAALSVRGRKASTIPEQEEKDRRSLCERLRHILPHALKIFFWVLAVTVLIHISDQHIEIKEWIGSNPAVVVLAAIIIGWIPQSGPHIIFIEMFAAGIIPLPVLIANCIVQDGHAGIPLIIKDWKAFIQIKTVKTVLALTVSIIWLLF